MNKLTRISATVASSVALVAGFAGVAGAAPAIHTTGPDSLNRITHRNSVRTDVRNDNDVTLTNNNPQTARSGNVTARRNTTVDGVSSGQAWNDSMLDANVSVDNSGATSAALDNAGGAGAGGSDSSNASITLTGPDSSNVVSERNSVDTRVSNDNDVHVTNNNRQSATSGNVTAERNTTVGDVTSGDASNTSTTTLSVNVSN